MGANSKHYGDVYLWVHKCIESCITLDQLATCRKLLGRFNKTYKNNPLHTIYDMDTFHYYIMTRVSNLKHLQGN